MGLNHDATLVERLRDRATWRDERNHCIASPAMLVEAANEIEALEFERTALRAERDELLSAAKRALNVLKAQGESVRPGNVLGALSSAIARAEPTQ